MNDIISYHWYHQYYSFCNKCMTIGIFKVLNWFNQVNFNCILRKETFSEYFLLSCWDVIKKHAYMELDFNFNCKVCTFLNVISRSCINFKFNKSVVRHRKMMIIPFRTLLLPTSASSSWGSWYPIYHNSC